MRITTIIRRSTLPEANDLRRALVWALDADHDAVRVSHVTHGAGFNVTAEYRPEYASAVSEVIGPEVG